MHKTVLQFFLDDKQVQELQDKLEVEKEQNQKFNIFKVLKLDNHEICLLYTSPSPRDS